MLAAVSAARMHLVALDLANFASSAPSSRLLVRPARGHLSRLGSPVRPFSVKKREGASSACFVSNEAVPYGTIVGDSWCLSLAPLPGLGGPVVGIRFELSSLRHGEGAERRGLQWHLHVSVSCAFRRRRPNGTVCWTVTWTLCGKRAVLAGFLTGRASLIRSTERHWQWTTGSCEL